MSHKGVDLEMAASCDKCSTRQTTESEWLRHCLHERKYYSIGPCSVAEHGCAFDERIFQVIWLVSPHLRLVKHKKETAVLRAGLRFMGMHASAVPHDETGIFSTEEEAPMLDVFQLAPRIVWEKKP